MEIYLKIKFAAYIDQIKFRTLIKGKNDLKITWRESNPPLLFHTPSMKWNKALEITQNNFEEEDDLLCTDINKLGFNE